MLYYCRRIVAAARGGSAVEEGRVAGFKRGAVVSLRSGRPQTTIDRIEISYGSPYRYGAYYWFHKLRVRYGRFALHALEIVQPKTGGDAGAAE